MVKDDNYIYHLLNRVYTIEISQEPDILFFSCFGKKHLKYKCLKIYYCGENRRPDFSGCDYALTYDLINHNRHFRWPLYAHHIDFENAWNKLTQPRTKEECKQIIASKKKFCCMVVSNANAKERIIFFNELSEYKQVDSGGKYLNNIGGAITNKMDFISICDTKLSTKDITQCIGRGLRSDELGEDNTNLEKILVVFIPTFIDSEIENKFEKIIEVLKYLIIDIELTFDKIIFDDINKKLSTIKTDNNKYDGIEEIKSMILDLLSYEILKDISYEKTKKIISNYNFSSPEEYLLYCDKDLRLPKDPKLKFKDQFIN